MFHFLLDIDSKENGTVLHIVSRQEWSGRSPKQDLDANPLPAKLVVIAHTATENCTTQVVNNYWAN